MMSEEGIDHEELERAEANVRDRNLVREQVVKSFQLDCPACSSSNTSPDVPWPEYVLFALFWLAPLWTEFEVFHEMVFLVKAIWIAVGIGIAILARKCDSRRCCRACGVRFRSIYKENQEEQNEVEHRI